MQRVMNQKRLISLDAFRGFTVAAMIIVNTPGSWDHVFPPLLHAPWNGVTPTDLIYPFFIFIVGISIALSYGKILTADTAKGALVGKALKRAMIIFGLGLFLWLFPDFNFAELRIPGVLQRIAVVFFACAVLFLYTSWIQQAFIGAGILVLYWAAMVLIPVPGVGTGVLEPGQNLAAWIDSQLIPGKMWQGTWDPEGILSTFPAIVTGICGMLVGKLFTNETMTQERKLVWLYLAGFVAFALGAAWGWVFPLNKNLWSSSFVLYTAGLGALTFASCYVLIDLQGYTRWAKLGVVFGSNAITAYVLGSILPGLFPGVNEWYVQTVVQSSAHPKLASFLWAFGICLLCYLPVYVLYRKRIFIKI